MTKNSNLLHKKLKRTKKSKLLHNKNDPYLIFFAIYFTKERSGTFNKLMTLDQRAWCAPINLKISQDEDQVDLMKLVKSSPVDKGTTTSLYRKKSGQLMSRVIQTAQDKQYSLKVGQN